MLPTSCVFRPGRFARTVQFCLLSVLPISANAERIVHFHLPAGEVATIFGSVYVGVEKVHEEQNVVLHDFGEAGVLIESHTGGAYCPSKFLLIHPDTGQLRSVNPGHDRETVFGECQRLSAVIPDLGLVVTMPETANEQARVFAWNGFRMSESVVKRSLQDVPLPAGGADVERWVDRYLFELARDPQEQKRLAEVLTEEQLEEFNRVIGQGSPMVRRGAFVVGAACWPGLCEGRWAVLALRVSDGAPFVRLSNGVIATPDMEQPPEVLLDINSLGQLPD